MFHAYNTIRYNTIRNNILVYYIEQHNILQVYNITQYNTM